MKKVLRDNLSLLKYVFKFSKELIFWKIVIVIVNVFVNLYVGVGFMKILIDSIEQGKKFVEISGWILGIAVLYIINSFLTIFYNNYINFMGKRKIHKGMHNLIFRKVRNVDLARYDDSKFYNDYIWALKEVDNRTIMAFENFMKFIQCILSVLSVIIAASMFDFGVLLFGLVPLIVSMIVANKNTALAYDYQNNLNPIEREKEYVKRVFYQKQYAKELKCFDVADVLISRFNICIDKSICLFRKYAKKIMRNSLIQDNVQNVVGMAMLSLYLAFKAIVMKSITIGTLTASFNAVNIFSSNLSTVFALYPKLKENALYAEKIFNIINYEPQIEGIKKESVMPTNFEKIVLKDVSFCYPGSQKKILNNINFEIKQGEKVAIVGLNGAGKSTLIKLIMHFYNPTSGDILYNEKNVKEYSTKEYRSHFSVIFQDYQLYAISLLENIFMRITNIEDKAIGRKLLERSCISEYKDYLGREVTKEFDSDGLVFSGGQEQKIAISRALAQNGEIVIMDEASSALDPISENKINKTLIEESKGKSMIIISHRLSTIRYVDRIYYMENGKVVESGTHAELMQKGDKYAAMYNAQAEKYLIEKE